MNTVERHKVLDDVFSDQKLPEEYRCLENIAFSHTYWRQGKYEFRAGWHNAARTSFTKAYKMAPKEYNVVELVSNIAITYLGYALIVRIQRAIKFLYSIVIKSRTEKSKPQSIINEKYY